MKILLYLGDAYFINCRVGVGTYHSNIIFGLNANYDIVVPENYSVNLPKNACPIHLSKTKKRVISLFKWFLPVNVFFKNYDCIVTDSFSFKKGKCDTRLFMIVHDCMVFTEPKNYTFFQRLYARIASKTFKQADCIIAVSETTKQALHDIFHLQYNKIKTVSNITDFYVESKKEKNFLYIGDMRKTKNLHNLILGFSAFLKVSNSSDNLIIAGRKKYEYELLQKQVEELKMEDRVIFTGYVTEEEKRKLFEIAKALVLISDNEGFGIPLIEAALNGLPVICSDIPIFHEILDEENAIFVDNKSVQSISNSFSNIEQKNILPQACQRLRNKYSVAMFYEKINELILQSGGKK